MNHDSEYCDFVGIVQIVCWVLEVMLGFVPYGLAYIVLYQFGGIWGTAHNITFERVI